MMHKECFPEKGWKVLSKLREIFVRHKAVLAGGTALALQIGNRISVDLDFFTADEFRVESIVSYIRNTGLPFRIMSESGDHLVVDVDGIKISIFKYDYPFLDKKTTYKGISIAGLIDIASMKVIAINQRGTKRDFVDLYCIIRNMPFYKIAENMTGRFGIERINPVHIGKSFIYFSDAESDPEPYYLKGKKIKWETVKKFFRLHVKQFVLDLDAAVRELSG